MKKVIMILMVLVCAGVALAVDAGAYEWVDPVMASLKFGDNYTPNCSGEEPNIISITRFFYAPYLPKGMTLTPDGKITWLPNEQSGQWYIRIYLDITTVYDNNTINVTTSNTVWKPFVKGVKKIPFLAPIPEMALCNNVKFEYQLQPMLPPDSNSNYDPNFADPNAR